MRLFPFCARVRIAGRYAAVNAPESALCQTVTAAMELPEFWLKCAGFSAICNAAICNFAFTLFATPQEPAHE